ncbi:MAG: hypothetical protein H7A46_09150 [Verrucomicrobiales bacterium]|nr:hypothetical protein [Verrucomicrobiales bacterium]
MAADTQHSAEQPAPVTPGITRAMVREHAFRIYRDRLPGQALSTNDWVMAEKDLVAKLQNEDGASVD